MKTENNLMILEWKGICKLIHSYYQDEDGSGFNSFELMYHAIEAFGTGHFFDEWHDELTDKGISYKEFLASRYWHVVAAEVKKRAANKCSLCASSKGLQAHHKTYQHHFLEHLHLEDLICLCGKCHGKFHDKWPKWRDGA